jgi:hypothetical protein
MLIDDGFSATYDYGSSCIIVRFKKKWYNNGEHMLPIIFFLIVMGEFRYTYPTRISELVKPM